MNRLVTSAFLLWTGAGLVFTLVPLTPEQVEAWHPFWLGDFIAFCLRYGDPVLILLAFAATHLHAARLWGTALARHWAILIIVLSTLIETVGTLTGFPFGAYRYTDQFGPLLGVVPITIPLAWHIILTNAYVLVDHFSKLRQHFFLVGFSALLCTLYDFILEPFATQVKHYWIWQQGTIPLQNYLAWLVFSAGLIGFFAPRNTPRRDWRQPALVLGGTLLIFIVGRLVHRL